MRLVERRDSKTGGWPENSRRWAGSGYWKSRPPFHPGPIFSFEVVRGLTRWTFLIGFRGAAAGGYLV